LLRGRIYVPLDELERFGYTEPDLERGVMNEPFRQLMGYQTARAREHFERGSRIVPLLSADSRACLALLHGVYSRILDRIEAAAFDVYSGRVGLPTHVKLLLMARLWGSSFIPSLLAQARRGRP
jgi:phytoene synthase